MIKFGSICIAAFFLLSCTSNNSDNKQKDQSIVIGEFSAMSGPQATFGKSSHLGVKLAIEEANKEGGIQGKPIKVISIDDKGSLTQTEAAVTTLAEKHKAIALIGEVSSARTLAAAKIAQQISIPLISPSATATSITSIGDFIFRACYIDPFQGSAMARFAIENLKAKKLAVLKDSRSEYSLGLAEYFVRTVESMGANVIAEDQYSSGDIDFKEPVSHLRSTQPDAIYIPGYYTDVGKIAKEIRKQGIKATLLGSDGWDSHRLYEIGRDSVNGSYFTNHFNAQNSSPEAKKFVRKFRKKYLDTPDGMAAMGYDATRMVIEALKKLKKIDRPSLKAVLTTTKNFSGVTGNISIDKNRNAIKPIVIVKVDGPINRFVTSIKPSKIENFAKQPAPKMEANAQ